MRFPAIRAQIGIWCYYVAVLSFEDISRYVKKVDEELHQSKTLSDMIQRSITDNYLNIKDYLLTQDERFFNSLVLAVYDGEPEWVEVELNYKGEEFFNMGFLEFTGKEKIFPVDGQHRVEGIKAAVKENNKLLSDKVPVVFIGHKNDNEGMQRSRRLFTTLNRYAKPVSTRDIIALDEDDSAAIITRRLVEKFPLFQGERIVFTAGKAIPESNKTAFTSIETLYQCNRALLEYFLKDRKIKVENFIKHCPDEKEINQYENICFGFWDSLISKSSIIQEYLSSTSSGPATKFRNRVDGGNLLFRPIGLLPFVLTATELCIRRRISFDEAIEKLISTKVQLNQQPWKRVLWDDIGKKMLRSDNSLVKLLLIYQVDHNLLTDKEYNKMKIEYAAKIGYEVESIDELLEAFRMS